MDKNELIALYLNLKLSEEQSKVFDHLMATDSNFAKEVKFQKDLKVAIEDGERKVIKSQLNDFEKEQKGRFNYKKLWIAASVIILLGVSGFWYLSLKDINTEKLYAENFSPYRNVVKPIVRSETKTDTKTKAFTAYEAKKHDEAIRYFDQLLNNNYDETIAFYKANSLMALNHIESAISILENNLKTKDSLDDKNQWYLALAYLKRDNTEKAKGVLKKLKNSSSFKNESVKQLLKKIEK